MKVKPNDNWLGCIVNQLLWIPMEFVMTHRSRNHNALRIDYVTKLTIKFASINIFMITEKMTEPIKETEQTNPNAQQELVNTLTQAIASSMEKMGTQLAQSLGQSLSQQYEEDYDDEFDEEQEEGETEATEEQEEQEEPARKRARTSGAFGVLENLLKNAAEPEETTSEIKENDDAADDILEALRQELNNEDIGEPVRKDIAELVQSLMKSGLPEEKLKEKMGTYARPENVPSLVPVKVNGPIWESLKPEARSMDLKMQKTHASLIKSITAATQAASTLRNTGQLNGTMRGVLKNILDSIVFNCQALRELNQRRKELLKPSINKNFAHLCSASIPVTDELFGSDLSKQIKDLSETNKISNQIRSRGQGRGRGRAPRRSSFLGRGAHRGSFNPNRGRGRSNRGQSRRGNPQRGRSYSKTD